ncbi:hypothetical protein cyc_00333 [Cyclospora cayetanensis]|uniref:Uncharacterized protein n=1 Tax=Cyclospora cayetanensis TaxID=88456 RepID=A0A1D3CTE0_9EIME|nr:hypothetical protein cyc_00333 [Cyclospora cayetanensis]
MERSYAGCGAVKRATEDYIAPADPLWVNPADKTNINNRALLVLLATQCEVDMVYKEFVMQRCLLPACSVVLLLGLRFADERHSVRIEKATAVKYHFKSELVHIITAQFGYQVLLADMKQSFEPYAA